MKKRPHLRFVEGDFPLNAEAMRAGGGGGDREAASATAGEGTMTEADLVRECEHAIRERRRAARVADKLFNQIPCSDPSRGPNLREVLNYYGEKNKIFGEVRSRPKPASAFNAGCADNGKEDITDLPACYRPGAGFNLNEELAKNPELIGELRRRAAANIGVHPSQLQSINHQPARRRAPHDEADGEDRSSSAVAKLPDDIARANMERRCRLVRLFSRLAPHPTTILSSDRAPPPPRRFCGHHGTRYRCSRCRSVYYCSAACQKRDWKATHHKTCKPVEDKPA